jgi:hypothetical protein
MTWSIRITSQMLAEVRLDLARRHPFAAERVGFVFARMGNRDGPEIQILPTGYTPIADDEYVDDPEVGARIDSAAIRRAMQTSLSQGAGVFHVHMHEHKGRPRYSGTDLGSYPDLVRGFRNVSPTVAHGALLLSRDSLECLVWTPGSPQPAHGGRIVVVGRPMAFLRSVGGLYA